MPRSLKLYVVGVVVIGAFALVAATFLFPPKPGIAIELPGGFACWSGRVGVRSWHPVLDSPDSDRVRVSGSASPRHAASRGDRPDHGRLVPGRSRCWRLGGGNRDDRSPGDSRPRSLVWHPRKPRHAGGACRSSRESSVSRCFPPSSALAWDFLAAMAAAAVFIFANLVLVSIALGLRTGQQPKDVLAR